MAAWTCGYGVRFPCPLACCALAARRNPRMLGLSRCWGADAGMFVYPNTLEELRRRDAAEGRRRTGPPDNGGSFLGFVGCVVGCLVVPLLALGWFLATGVALEWLVGYAVEPGFVMLASLLAATVVGIAAEAVVSAVSAVAGRCRGCVATD